MEFHRVALLGSFFSLLNFDDIGHGLSHCNIIMKADVTVIYTTPKHHHELQEKLSDDFNRVASCSESKDIIIGLKTGKTKCMLFGTSHKIKNK